MTISLNVEGMSCSGCTNAVRRVLEAAPSVTHVSVELETGRATVRTSSTVDPATLISAVEDAGYDCTLAA
jgi:copper chaperone CopZ